MYKGLSMRKAIFSLLKLAWFALGLFIFGFSVVLILEANLGLSPWDVLHISLTQYLPFTFGQIMIGTGVLCVVVAYPMGIRPKIGTILNMILIGVFVDLIMLWGLIPQANGYMQQYLYLLFGICGCGLGTGTYITAYLGTGPRDSLMMGLHRLTGRGVGTVRTLIEVTVVTLGFLLGGKIGIGTLAFSLTIGWFTQAFLTIFNWCGKQEWFCQWVSAWNAGHEAVGNSKGV